MQVNEGLFMCSRKKIVNLRVANRKHMLTPISALVLAAIAAYAPGQVRADTPAAAPLPASSAAPAPVQFNNQFLLGPGGKPIDVSRFAQGNPVMPGSYDVGLYVNGDWIARSGVRFVARAGSDSAVPCFDRQLLEHIGLNFQALTPAARSAIAKAQNGECVDLSQVVESASFAFDMSELRLDLSIPQIAMLRHPQGYVSPEFWDAGVPSATLNYNFNTFHTTGQGAANTQSYLGIGAGVNIGSWHFRHDAALTTQSGGPTQYQAIDTYVQHDIPSLKAQLTIGDSFTDGQMFDSMGIRGVQLASDDRMLPESQRGYAPVIRGIANSNARVTVTQNGNKLYETMVPPGPFEIDDLYATGYGGNLLVSVTEANGSTHSFVVPYSSVVQLLRPGISRFSLAAGQIRDAQISQHEAIMQATLQHGFNDFITGYTGAVAAQGYVAGLVGAAFNTPIGGVSVDLTQANAQIAGVPNTSGQSLRISYSKLFPDTGSNIGVAAYRYSSAGFWSVRNAMLARDAVAQGQSTSLIDRQRNQLQLTYTQTLAQGWGSFYAIDSTQNYWNRGGVDNQFQVGYSNAYHNISYTLSAGRQSSGLIGPTSTQVFLSVSMPLGRGNHAPTLQTSYTHDSLAGASVQSMLSGTAGSDNQFSYGVTGNRISDSNSVGANGQYRSPYGTVSSSFTTGSGYTQTSAGVQGSVVAHPGGVTLGQSLGDTVGIIDAPDAAGARVVNAAGVRVDPFGYAVVPYLTPYMINTIEIDPKGLPLDVQLNSTSQQVAPRANSVVMIKFGTSKSRSALIKAKFGDGRPVPFGASVLNEKGTEIGIVGQNGSLFVRDVTADSGVLSVTWGSGPQDRCTLPYTLPPQDPKKMVYERLDAVCTAPAK